MPIKISLKKNSLLSIRKLFEKSFELYLKNFKSLIFIMLLTYIPIAIFDIITKKISMSAMNMEANSMVILSALAIIFLLLCMFILTIVNQIALIYFIDKKSSIQESFAAAKKYFFSYLFINIIFLIIIQGASLLLSTFSGITSDFLIKTISSKTLLVVLFFVLFLAIIILILHIIIKLLFSFIILVVENLKGMQALKRSNDIIGAYWQPVAVRFVSLILVVAVINRIFAYIASMIASFPFSYYLAYFIAVLPFIFIIPFALIYIYTVYKNLNEI